MLALPVGADPLADLRQVLERYPAKTAFAATARLQVHGDAKGEAGGARGGAATFEIESGPAGFTMRLLSGALRAAEDEAAAKKRDPDSPTPTRTAVAALTIFDVIDSVDAASMLLDDLSGGILLDRRPAVYEGKPAALLRIKVKSTLAGTRSKFVNEPKIELRVWVGADGIPLAAERDSDFSASFLFLKAGNVRTERWDFAVAGDRLYAAQNDSSNRASVAGKSIVSSRSVAYTPK